MNIPGNFAKFDKCPCCRNPWNQSSDEQDSSFIACGSCLVDTKGYSGIDPSNFDNTKLPTDNFYLWANGGWKEKNPIPPEYSSWNTFMGNENTSNYYQYF